MFVPVRKILQSDRKFTLLPKLLNYYKAQLKIIPQKKCCKFLRMTCNKLGSLMRSNQSQQVVIPANPQYHDSQDVYIPLPSNSTQMQLTYGFPATYLLRINTCYFQHQIYISKYDTIRKWPR